MEIQSEKLKAEVKKAEAIEDLKARLGRFRISNTMLRAMAYKLFPVFGEMIIFEARNRYEFDAVEYLALCKRFKKIEIGTEAPLYELILRDFRDGSTKLVDVVQCMEVHFDVR